LLGKWFYHLAERRDNIPEQLHPADLNTRLVQHSSQQVCDAAIRHRTVMQIIGMGSEDQASSRLQYAHGVVQEWGCVQVPAK
jgi:hypothetical protein